MLATLIKQTNWSILGSIFGIVIGFLIKGYVVQSVGLEGYGLYIKGYVFITAISTIIAFGFPQVVSAFAMQCMHCVSLGADFLVYIDCSPSPAPSECSLGAFFCLSCH